MRSSPNRNRIVIAAAFLALVMVGPTRAAILFQDTFNRANSSDLNASTTGQSGTLAPLTYTAVPAGSDYHHQLSSNRLMLLTDSGGVQSTMASPDHNFTESLGGATPISSVSFDVDPWPVAVGDAWAAISLGAALGDRNTTVNAANTHFGILFRDNGSYEAYDGSSSAGTGNLAWTSGAIFHHIELQISDVDGNPWNGAGSSTINVFTDNSLTPFLTYTKGSGGYTSNYVTLQGYTSNRDTYHLFDNLTVSLVPEPATLALLGVGGLLLRRRQR